MIITRLAGGLGNQMFHYAIARNYLKDEHEKIFLDTYLLKEEEEDIEKITQRPFSLNIYNSLKGIVDEKRMFNLLRSESLVNRIKRKYFWINCTVVDQKLMEQVELPDTIRTSKNLLFRGNFQSERYFKEIRSQLLSEFGFPKMDYANEELKRRMLDTSDAVSIHIRRGDYLSSWNKDVFNSVNINYYHKAINILLSKLGAERLKAFVFTDDVEWVKQNFNASERLDVQYVIGNTSNNSWKDMALMTACRHHIIANSSFSWWGAWLSTRSGINFAPKYWFMPNSSEFDINDIVPQSWNIVDYPL